jgi:hypothetical protein
MNPIQPFENFLLPPGLKFFLKTASDDPPATILNADGTMPIKTVLPLRKVIGFRVAASSRRQGAHTGLGDDQCGLRIAAGWPSAGAESM